jgi:preprotein translocase subunit SecD
MRGSRRLLLGAFAMTAALPCLAADIAFSSVTDFTQMSLQLRTADNANPQSIGLNVTLAPEAQRRLAQVTRQAMHQPLRLVINGVLVSTATIQAVLEGPGLMISIPRDIARDLVPTLLEPSTP